MIQKINNESHDSAYIPVAKFVINQVIFVVFPDNIQLMLGF